MRRLSLLLKKNLICLYNLEWLLCKWRGEEQKISKLLFWPTRLYVHLFDDRFVCACIHNFIGAFCHRVKLIFTHCVSFFEKKICLSMFGMGFHLYLPSNPTLLKKAILHHKEFSFVWNFVHLCNRITIYQDQILLTYLLRWPKAIDLFKAKLPLNQVSIQSFFF